jgi:hypothetical protein
MKKILSLLSIVVLASCGNVGTPTEVKTDSTVVDSIKMDSTVVIPLVDSVELGGPQPANTENKKTLL